MTRSEVESCSAIGEPGRDAAPAGKPPCHEPFVAVIPVNWALQTLRIGDELVCRGLRLVLAL